MEQISHNNAVESGPSRKEEIITKFKASFEEMEQILKNSTEPNVAVVVDHLEEVKQLLPKLENEEYSPSQMEGLNKVTEFMHTCFAMVAPNNFSPNPEEVKKRDGFLSDAIAMTENILTRNTV